VVHLISAGFEVMNPNRHSQKKPQGETCGFFRQCQDYMAFMSCLAVAPFFALMSQVLHSLAGLVAQQLAPDLEQAQLERRRAPAAARRRVIVFMVLGVVGLGVGGHGL
jgi:hypothetical protein